MALRLLAEASRRVEPSPKVVYPVVAPQRTPALQSTRRRRRCRRRRRNTLFRSLIRSNFPKRSLPVPRSPDKSCTLLRAQILHWLPYLVYACLLVLDAQSLLVNLIIYLLLRV